MVRYEGSRINTGIYIHIWYEGSRINTGISVRVVGKGEVVG
jgi:hypothetical protein